MKKNMIMMLIIASVVSVVSCKKLDSEKIELMNISEVLMKESPDSSLAILRSIDLSDLYSKPAKARYALLYTKAQHKCYDTISNDSIINIAVEYYKENGGDKDYGEALMYRGAALYDMMDYKEALNSYKLAEDILEGGEEYKVLALINSRMGDLHKMLFSDAIIAIDRYKSAAYYYNLIEDKKNEGRAYHWIGSRYILVPNRDSALFYLHKSLDIAKEINDNGVVNSNNYLLMLLHNNLGEYKDAIKIGVSALNQTGKIPRNIIHKLSRAYAKVGNIGSARMYFDRYKLGSEKSLADYLTLTVIEENAKNYKDALMYHKEVREITNYSVNKKRESEIVMAEKRFDYQKVLTNSMVMKEQHRTHIYIGLLILSVCFIIILVLSNVSKKRKRDIAAKASFIEHLRIDSEAASSSFLKQLSKKNATESRLKEIMEKRINALGQLMEVSYRYGTNESLFLREYNKVMNMEKLGKDVLRDICDVVNIKSGGIIDYISEHHPALTMDDLCFIALVYYKFAPTAICTLCSYSKPDSVYVRKNRISNKMGLTVQLDVYLASIKLGDDE